MTDEERKVWDQIPPMRVHIEDGCLIISFLCAGRQLDMMRIPSFMVYAPQGFDARTSYNGWPDPLAECTSAGRPARAPQKESV